MIQQLDKWERELEVREQEKNKAMTKPPVAVGGKVSIVLYWKDGTNCLACDTFNVDKFVFELGPPEKMVLKEHPEMYGIAYNKGENENGAS